MDLINAYLSGKATNDLEQNVANVMNDTLQGVMNVAGKDLEKATKFVERMTQEMESLRSTRSTRTNKDPNLCYLHEGARTISLSFRWNKELGLVRYGAAIFNRNQEGHEHVPRKCFPRNFRKVYRELSDGRFEKCPVVLPVPDYVQNRHELKKFIRKNIGMAHRMKELKEVSRDFSEDTVAIMDGWEFCNNNGLKGPRLGAPFSWQDYLQEDVQDDEDCPLLKTSVNIPDLLKTSDGAVH